jgi:hypothetical protein
MDVVGSGDGRTGQIDSISDVGCNPADGFFDGVPK